MGNEFGDAISSAGLDDTMKIMLEEWNADEIAEALWNNSCANDDELLRKWIANRIEKELTGT